MTEWRMPSFPPSTDIYKPHLHVEQFSWKQIGEGQKDSYAIKLYENYMQSWVGREKKQFVGDLIPRTGYKRGGVLQGSKILLREGIKPHVGLPRPGVQHGEDEFP